MSFFIDAKNKIESAVSKAEKCGQKERTIAKPTANALIEFAKQNDEFAQAIVQGKSFEECVKHICKNIGNACSDLTVYQKAVEFYFPGAVVEFQMNIKMSKFENESDNIINIDFTDFI